MRTGEPWDFKAAAQLARALPTPDNDSVRRLTAADGSPGWRSPLLTPEAWAFAWELSHSEIESLPTLLEEYPNELATPGYEAVRHLAKSVGAYAGTRSPGEALVVAEACLISALDLLANHVSHDTEFLGEHLWVQLNGEPKKLIIGGWGLLAPGLDTLLLHLAERAPSNYPFSEHLLWLWRVTTANAQYGSLDDEDVKESKLPALKWMTERSVAFLFAAAQVTPGTFTRIEMLLDGLVKVANGYAPPFCRHFAGELEEGVLTDAEIKKVCRSLAPLSFERSAVEDLCGALWQEVLPEIFDAMRHASGEALLEVTECAAEFESELERAGKFFLLGYLNQCGNEPQAAMGWYLKALLQSSQGAESLTKNAKLLLLKASSAEQVLGLLRLLEESRAKTPEAPVGKGMAAVTSSGAKSEAADEEPLRQDILKQLIDTAKTRHKELVKQEQYEKTAVNRWPTLSAQARKVLSVFCNIQSYSSLDEIADYAGMNREWTYKHYDRLVELGMLSVSEGHFRVNPYIRPLVEKEAQHSVVGKIVRSNGTSAVKQVFNSNKEFTVYQAVVQLCPNHLVFPNCSLQSIMSFERMKELVEQDDFGYYLRASVDIVVVSSTTYLPMLAIEVDSAWHDTERQQKNDDKKDRLFAVAGIPFMRLRAMGSPSEDMVRSQVAEHVNDLVRELRADLPGYEQAKKLIQDLSGRS